MSDDITIGVTEIVNNIEVTAQPNDQIVDISVTDNADNVTLNITPTVIEINVNKGSSYAKWGDIYGTLSDQTDLQNALNLKANLVGGKVPASELPSYVDDIIEVANYAALPATGEIGKIYVTLDNNKIYRWSGSVYIEIASNSAIWGAITGTLSSQTDLVNALNLRVPYTGATSNVNLGEYGLTSGFLALDTTPTSTPTGIGTIYWDATNRTASLIDGDGDTTLQIGQEERILVHNNTGATLTDGQVVYVTGSTGNLPSVALANASSETTSAATLGVVTESIANGADGFVTISGIVNGLNTLAFNEGDLLWLGTTAGTFTATKPISPSHLVLIGYVIKKAGGNGSILVKVQNTQELKESSDVLFTSLTNKDFLVYESATDLWKNKSLGTVLAGTSFQFVKGDGSLDSTDYVPTARTLTINGTAYDLTADRSWTIATHNPVGIGTSNGLSIDSNQQLSLALASTSTNGALSSTDWNTFNGKQNALTNPVTGTGTTNYIPKFIGASALGNSQIFDNGTNVGIATNVFTPAAKLHLVANTTDLIPALGTTNDSAAFAISTQASSYGLLSGVLSTGNVWIQAQRFVGNPDAFNLLIQPNGGNVLIATTTNAGFRLDVNGTARVQGALTATADSTINGLSIGLGGGSISTNTRVGASALNSNTTGFENAALGRQTLNANTTGFQNTAIGNQALFLLQTGNNNIAIGNNSLLNAVTPSENISIGGTSLLNHTTGNRNVSIGHLAARYIGNKTTNATNTSNSIFLGYRATPLANSQTNQIVIGHDATGLGSNTTVLGNSSTTTTAIYGNVGIGTTSPGGKLHVVGEGIFDDGTNGRLTFANASSQNDIYSTTTSFGGWKNLRLSSNELILSSGGTTERMRITSGGDVLVGISATYTNARYQGENITGSKAAMALRAQATTASTILEFWNPNGQVGDIRTNGSSTGYYTSSDYRLKQDLKSFNGLDLISNIKVYDYEWKIDKTRSYGVMAHELQEVIPDAVTGDKDGEKMQSVDYSKLVPILVASIQELKAEIELLKSKL